MTAIHKALDECSAEHPVFYEDEVDSHLNPKIVAGWQLSEQQKRMVTLGQNKNTIWLVRDIVEQAKSATLVETVKIRRCSSAC